ncbi:HTH-type transcriptional regulator CymR [bioreactor metagenome]|uniref:HTH-type transcriptional regulator CymR n=1 Tax=bioreactor metagenome TaxID=1076179 RepID=A0A645ATR9_9ZZZZ
MMISTKGRYALRIMLDLAQHREDGYISLSKISQRQGISVKYLEAIISVLNKAGMVESQRGKEGGYQLTKGPEEYSVGAIVKLTEGSIAPVACLENDHVPCEHRFDCLTLPLWIKLEGVVDNYLESVSLIDLLERKI